MSARAASSPWIRSPAFDGLWILSPAWLATGIALLFHRQWNQTTEVPLWAWAVFILGIDVAHVYSTFYRTYFDRSALEKYPRLLEIVPIACWGAGVLLYALNGRFFWSALAYLAVFHFIRQQYGFFKIYGRHEANPSPWASKLDAAAIYAATLYPLLYWHTHLPRNFHWFIDGDFIALPYPLLNRIGLLAYAALLIAYLTKELWIWREKKIFNLPRNLLLLGTAVSWYVGIVLFNGDMIFTLTNVVAHGVPYMALVWLYGRKKEEKDPLRSRPFSFFSPAMIPLFLGLLILFAYLEEGLWDGLIWRDRTALFSFFALLPQVTEKTWLTWLVPLLALPQSTHYVLDGFLWRIRPKESELNQIVFPALHEPRTEGAR
ncbi:MAG: hypothetical protein U1F57_01380 [bacterium]